MNSKQKLIQSVLERCWESRNHLSRSTGFALSVLSRFCTVGFRFFITMCTTVYNKLVLSYHIIEVEQKISSRNRNIAVEQGKVK